MKHLKPLSMNPMMVKKIHSNQWIISKGERMSQTMSVRFLKLKGRKNMATLRKIYYDYICGHYDQKIKKLLGDRYWKLFNQHNYESLEIAEMIYNSDGNTKHYQY